MSGRTRGRRGFDWVPEGPAVGGRGEADLGREVLAQAGSVPEPGMLGDLLDGELRGLQEASGEEQPLRDEPVVRRGAGAGPELSVEGAAAHRESAGELIDGQVLG